MSGKIERLAGRRRSVQGRRRSSSGGRCCSFAASRAERTLGKKCVVANGRRVPGVSSGPLIVGEPLKVV